MKIAIEAFKFGFKTIIKRPLFFMYALIVTKLVWLAGLMLSSLLAFPFFLPLISFVQRIIEVLKGVLSGGILKMFDGGLTPDGAKGAGEVAKGIGKMGGFLGGAAIGGAGGGGALGAAKGGLIGGGIQTGLKLYSAVKDIINEIMQSPMLFVLFVIGLIIFILTSRMVYDFLILGWTRIALEFKDKGFSSIRSLFSTSDSLFKYFLATVAFGFILIIPLELFGVFYLVSMIPALPLAFSKFIVFLGYIVSSILLLFVSSKFWFYGYFIVGENADVVESLKKSYMLKGVFYNFVSLFVMFGLATLVPLSIFYILPTVGLILLALYVAVSSMAGYLAMAFLYRKMMR